MQRGKNLSAFGQLENGKNGHHRMTKHMSLKLKTSAGGGSISIGGASSNPDMSCASGIGGSGSGGLKHQNTVTGATTFTAMKRRNKVGQISNSTRERWRQTTRNIKVSHGEIQCLE